MLPEAELLEIAIMLKRGPVSGAGKRYVSRQRVALCIGL
jgi:hypothetical protein